MTHGDMPKLSWQQKFRLFKGKAAIWWEMSPVFSAGSSCQTPTCCCFALSGRAATAASQHPSFPPVLSGYPLHLIYRRQQKRLQRSHQHDSSSVTLFPGFRKSPATIPTPAPLLCPLPLLQRTSSSTQCLLVLVLSGSFCLLRVGSLTPIKHKPLVSGTSSLRQTALLMDIKLCMR